MAAQARSNARDTVSFICFKHYGTTKGRVVEKVFEANPHLFEYGPRLPAGVEIILPDIESIQEVTKIKRLWDY